MAITKSERVREIENGKGETDVQIRRNTRAAKWFIAPQSSNVLSVGGADVGWWWVVRGVWSVDNDYKCMCSFTVQSGRDCSLE